MMKIGWKTVAGSAAALAALGVLIGAAALWFGWYDVSALRQHTQPVYSLLDVAMRRSVQLRARAIVVPESLGTAQNVRRGAAVYHARCVQCHGGPGVARQPFGMAMQPIPAPMIAAARHWSTRELYWITRHGIKLSGMPAWEFHLPDADLWAVTAFLEKLPELTPMAYAALTTEAVREQPAEAQAPPGRPAEADARVAATPAQDAATRLERGRLALRQYACHACHAIPGITGPEPMVGPPLDGFAGGQLIAGRLANTHDNLVAWIRHPQRIDARTAMPDLGVTPEHAEQMAAYLETLR